MKIASALEGLKLNLRAVLTLKLIHLEDQLQKQEVHDQHKNRLRLTIT